MYQVITSTIAHFSDDNITEERKAILAPLISYISDKNKNNAAIRLNFICTHNSRRSHMSQIWAQSMAYLFKISNVDCYSGGTACTAMFPKVVETLKHQGFYVNPLSEGPNPVYAVKYDDHEYPIICFSKLYNDNFNPRSDFAAILTCDSADQECPLVVGAEMRFPVKFDDPKAFDGTDLQNQKYRERSLEIGQEMWFIFKSVAQSILLPTYNI